LDNSKKFFFFAPYLIQKQRLRNENNLFKSPDNYLKYTSYQHESEAITTTAGKLHGNVYVKLDFEKFTRYLEKYGVLAN